MSTAQRTYVRTYVDKDVVTDTITYVRPHRSDYIVNIMNFFSRVKHTFYSFLQSFYAFLRLRNLLIIFLAGMKSGNNFFD